MCIPQKSPFDPWRAIFEAKYCKHSLFSGALPQSPSVSGHRRCPENLNKVHSPPPLLFWGQRTPLLSSMDWHEGETCFSRASKRKNLMIWFEKIRSQRLFKKKNCSSQLTAFPQVFFFVRELWTTHTIYNVISSKNARSQRVSLSVSLAFEQIRSQRLFKKKKKMFFTTDCISPKIQNLNTHKLIKTNSSRVFFFWFVNFEQPTHFTMWLIQKCIMSSKKKKCKEARGVMIGFRRPYHHSFREQPRILGPKSPRFWGSRTGTSSAPKPLFWCLRITIKI